MRRLFLCSHVAMLGTNDVRGDGMEMKVITMIVLCILLREFEAVDRK